MNGGSLFVPLKGEYFEKFLNGEKTTEYRAFGPRWNHATCWPGRSVTLSLGYSGARLMAVIRDIQVLEHREAPKAAQEIYPKGKLILAIHLEQIHRSGENPNVTNPKSSPTDSGEKA